MQLVLVTAASLAMALASAPREEDQNLLPGNSSVAVDQEVKDLNHQDVVRRNVKLVIESVNANAKRSEENLKRVVSLAVDRLNANADVNAERSDANAKRAEGLLEKILTALGGEKDDQGRDCADLSKKGQRTSGSYVISIPKVRENLTVYCDMETDGGGWTVFQRRGNYSNPEDFFYRSWGEYRDGFGDLDQEFWLGNDILFELTQQKASTLRVDLWDMEGQQAYAKYDIFRVEHEAADYRLTVGKFSGDAGDSLSWSQGSSFSTNNRNNVKGVYAPNCAEQCRGAWWYEQCGLSNLNGLNLRGRDDNKGMTWYTWKSSRYSMAASEMKLRPTDF